MANVTTKDGDSYSDHFTQKGMVGKGGIGRVLLGFDTNIKREVAIKELLLDRPGLDKDKAMSRFMREARISGQLEHPGIVPVYELGSKEDGTAYYVMKYVQGRTLGEILSECIASTPEESFRIRIKYLDNLISVAEAIAYAHSKGVIHRDIKPQNIIIGEFGETIILDWGLAKVWPEEDDLEKEIMPWIELGDEKDFRTRQGSVLGTPPYLPPEQADPKFGDIDPRSDVYALGVLLYMILSGDKPYRGKTQDMLEKIRSEEPSPSPSMCGQFIPPELCAICEKAMAKNKTDRFENAAQFAEELRAYRSGRLVSIYAYSAGELFKRFVARNKAAIIATVVVMLAIIAGAAFSLHFAYDAHSARLRAENALVDVTGLSEEAMNLARKITGETDDFLENFIEQAQGTAPEAIGDFIKDHPGVEAVKIVPKSSERTTMSKAYFGDNDHHLFDMIVPLGGGNAQRSYSITIRFDDVTPIMFGIDPTKSAFQVWCMQGDGYIVYDEDPRQIGLNLFSDALYANFPELLEFGEKIKAAPYGVGYYSFLSKDESRLTYKVAAWDTINTLGWKIVVTHPYITK